MQLFPLKFLPDNPKIDFMKLRNASIAITGILLVISFYLMITKSFNFGIDFAGGINMEVRASQEPDLAAMRQVLGDLEIGEVMLQNFGSTQDLSIRVGISSEEQLLSSINLIKKTLADNFTYEFDYRNVSFVGPQVGAEMIKSGSIAMVLAFVSIMFYVWVRFEWQFGLGVLLALVHDVIIALGFMSYSRFDFNLATIAAILTIIGYSVNDSVVIYDRIRENLRKYSKKDISDIINLSINETLSRTTITVFTTLLANLALIIWGGEAIQSFSVLVFFGVLIGTLSSIFISAPILTMFRFKHFKNTN